MDESLWSALRHGDVANWDDHKRAITIEHALTSTILKNWRLLPTNGPRAKEQLCNGRCDGV